MNRVKERPVISLGQYNQPSCPYCRSYEVRKGFKADSYGQQVLWANERHFCDNCKRMWHTDKTVWRRDRKAIKRHIKKLQKILDTP